MRKKEREMRGALFAFSLLIAVCLIELSSAAVVLKRFSVAFPDLPSRFAHAIDSFGVCGALQLVDPLDGCSSLRNVVGSNATDRIWFALIGRGNCAFEEKILNAQIAGFRAAIVYDDRDKGNLVYMMINPNEIEVPAVFVTKAAGEFLKEHARGEDGECCIYPSHAGAAWTVLAICLLSVLVIFSFLAIAFLAPGHWSNWRGRNQLSKSVDTSMVEALPHVTFNSSQMNHFHMGETCAICLEDYKDGEILKVLPCQHDFHSSCVDLWLTKWGTCCPVCKLDMTTKTAYSEVKRGTWV